MSLAAAGCSGPRHLFPIAVHCAVSVSATLPLIMSLPLLMTRLQSRSDVAAAHQRSGCADKIRLLVSVSVSKMLAEFSSCMN